jgi:adenylylsulfate kinase
MENLTKQIYKVQREHRNRTNNHNSFVIWFTGLSGSGKSTIANLLDEKLTQMNIKSYVLDGDNMRMGLNKDLGFTEEARKENIRRVAEVAKLFVDAGTVVITSFISPFEEDRQIAKAIIGSDDFFEVFISCPIEVCEKRDAKGLYAKARKGEIRNFTGIDSPFEEPIDADVVVETDKTDIYQCTQLILKNITNKLKRTI